MTIKNFIRLLTKLLTFFEEYVFFTIYFYHIIYLIVLFFQIKFIAKMANFSA